MAAFIDSDQIQVMTVGGQEVVIIPVAVPVSEVATELAEYDPESGSHPLAAQAKPLARPLLDALAAFWASL